MRNFTGRTQELERLLAALRSFSLIALEGPPGSGKTALALELANRLEGTVWLKAEPGWHCESVLYALGMTFEGPLPLREQLGLAARSLKAPLVLDDFHCVQDGALLLEVWAQYLRDATVLLTSRERLQADVDVFRLRLDALAEAEALLHKLLEQHGLQDWLAHTPRLLQLAGGLPLQIKMLVGLIRDRRLDLDHPPSQLFDGLSLSDQERDTMAFLAVLGRPVRLDETPALASLESRFLVERGPDGLYSSHEVFRDYFRSDSKALHDRAAEHELACLESSGDLEVARNALRHLYAAGRLTEAADLLEQYQVRLFQSAQYEFLLEWIDRVGGGKRLQIAKADVLAYLGRTRESLKLLEQVERTGDPEERMQALNSRCHLVLEQGDLEQAARLARESLELQRRASGRRPGRVKALNGLALACARMGRIQEAELHACEALEQAWQIADPRGQAYAHYALALAAWAQDRWADCLTSARNCQKACRAGGEARLGFLSRFLEGNCLQALGREASAVFRKSLEEAELYPDPLSRAMAELGRPDPDRALEYAEQHGGKVFLAQVLLLAGNYERGARLARQAGAVPLECELSLRLERQRSDPRPAELERWRQKAAELGLTGTEQRARLALQEVKARRLYRLVTRAGEERLSQPVLPRADLQLDLVARKLSAFGEEVPILRKKTLTSVLRALMLAYPEPLSQKELYQRAWAAEYQDQDSDAAVRKAISQLRDRLEPDRANPKVIQVREAAYVQKGGYVLGVPFALLETDS